MSDNFNQATITPSLPGNAFTPAELARLAECGLRHEPADEGLLYFFAEDGIDVDADSEDDEDAAVTCPYEILQQALRRCDTSLTALSIEGAETCSKMRPGAFGGYCAYITRERIYHGSTTALLQSFAREAGHVTD
jgi:hypothetical protein